MADINKEEMMGEQTVAKLSEIPPGSCKQVEVEDEPIGLYNVDGQIYAISDICTHAHGYLSEGDCQDAVVTCPLHGARFDLKTGKALTMPATEPVKTYAVKIEGDDIKIVV